MKPNNLFQPHPLPHYFPLPRLPPYLLLNEYRFPAFNYSHTSISSVQFSRSVTSDSLRPQAWTAARQASKTITNSQSLLKLMSIESVSSNHLILCHPLLLLPSIFHTIRVFSSESALCIRWSKYWSFSFRSVLSVNIQGSFPLGLTGLTSLLSKGLSRVFSSTTV